MKFIADVKTEVEDAGIKVSSSDLSSEQMLFSADWEFARNNGGPITLRLMDKLFDSERFKRFVAVGTYPIVIDTRVTMTMPGMYPSIPGWHCDDVPRRSDNGQPDLEKVTSDVRHFMAIISDLGGVTNTEFVTEDIEIDIDENNVWNSVDRYVEENGPRTGKLKDNQIISFSQTAIHRAGLCTKRGWRLFFRASFTHRPAQNEIRKQVQIYTTANGW